MTLASMLAELAHSPALKFDAFTRSLVPSSPTQLEQVNRGHYESVASLFLGGVR